MRRVSQDRKKSQYNVCYWGHCCRQWGSILPGSFWEAIRMPSKIFHLKDGIMKHLYTGSCLPLSRVALEVLILPCFCIYKQVKWTCVDSEKTFGETESYTVYCWGGKGHLRATVNHMCGWIRGWPRSCNMGYWEHLEHSTLLFSTEYSKWWLA